MRSTCPSTISLHHCEPPDTWVASGHESNFPTGHALTVATVGIRRLPTGSGRASRSTVWKDKGEIQNLDLVQRLDALMARHDVRWTWVRGHAGNRGNEHVDRLASLAMDRMSKGDDVEAEKRYGPGKSPIRVPAAALERAAASK